MIRNLTSRTVIAAVCALLPGACTVGEGGHIPPADADDAAEDRDGTTAPRSQDPGPSTPAAAASTETAASVRATALAVDTVGLMFRLLGNAPGPWSGNPTAQQALVPFQGDGASLQGAAGIDLQCIGLDGIGLGTLTVALDACALGDAVLGGTVTVGTNLDQFLSGVIAIPIAMSLSISGQTPAPLPVTGTVEMSLRAGSTDIGVSGVIETAIEELAGIPLGAVAVAPDLTVTVGASACIAASGPIGITLVGEDLTFDAQVVALELCQGACMSGQIDIAAGALLTGSVIMAPDGSVTLQGSDGSSAPLPIDTCALLGGAGGAQGGDGAGTGA